MKRILPLSVLLVPTLALALNFTDVSGNYTDRSHMSLAERAGVSVLTEIGAVQGNPDGTFAPERTLNRAEFLKIAFESNAKLSVTPGDADDCFPDVQKDDWFSKYVCLAKKRGDVEGYPDGMFKPGNAVNYVEAVKMLVELYNYTLPEPAANERWAWYTPYLRAADEHKVLLPIAIENDAALTRGQMARLAAAFVAENQGQLSAYREFETTGRVISSKQSSSRSSGSSESSGSSKSSGAFRSSASSVSSSIVLTPSIYPAQNSFLVADQVSDILLDGIFLSPEDDATLFRVQVELHRRINSLESLIFVDPAGVQIAELKLQTYDNQSDTKWRVDVLTGGYVIPKGVPLRMGIKAKVKPFGTMTSNELFELKTLSLLATEKISNNSRQIVPTDTHYPMHQTSFGRITSVRNDLATSLTVPEGKTRTIGTFTVAGQAAEGASVELESLTFKLDATDVLATNIRLGGSSAVQQEGCATESIDAQVFLTCPVPESMRTLTTAPVTFSVYADVAVAIAKTGGTIRLNAFDHGGIGKNGVVRWTDTSGTFNWIEHDVPLDSGPMVTVTK